MRQKFLAPTDWAAVYDAEGLDAAGLPPAGALTDPAIEATKATSRSLGWSGSALLTRRRLLT